LTAAFWEIRIAKPLHWESVKKKPPSPIIGFHLPPKYPPGAWGSPLPLLPPATRRIVRFASVFATSSGVLPSRSVAFTLATLTR
jgi:hypothetical protein